MKESFQVVKIDGKMGPKVKKRKKGIQPHFVKEIGSPKIIKTPKSFINLLFRGGETGFPFVIIILQSNKVTCTGVKQQAAEKHPLSLSFSYI